MSDRRRGTITRYGPRGFGYIQSSGEEFFFHIAQVRDKGNVDERALEGKAVTFVAGMAQKGPTAWDVEIEGEAE